MTNYLGLLMKRKQVFLIFHRSYCKVFVTIKYLLKLRCAAKMELLRSLVLSYQMKILGPWLPSYMTTTKIVQDVSLRHATHLTHTRLHFAVHLYMSGTVSTYGCSASLACKPFILYNLWIKT